jgi:hypothetical protein
MATLILRAAKKSRWISPFLLATIILASMTPLAGDTVYQINAQGK